MICRYCNSVLAAGALTCTQCGAPQPLPTPQAAQPRRRQMEFRVSWGEPTVDAIAPPLASPLATHQAPPPYAAPSAYAAQPSWGQHHAPYWVPAPRMRSFRWQAIFALILYFPFFLPGLIANIIWWNQARNLEAATGIAPRGKGCLTVMLVCAVIMMLLSVGIAGIF
jgi:hypothetical protein